MRSDVAAKPTESAEPASVVVALAASWLASGSTYIGMRIVTQLLPPLTINAVRLACTCAVLTIPFIWRVRTISNRPRRAEIVNAIVAGILMILLFHTLLIIGVSRTAAGTAAVFASSSPLMVALLGWWLAGEPVSGRRALGLGLGVVGLILMGRSAFAEGDFDLLGTAAIVAGSAAWACGAHWSRHHDLPKDLVISVTIQTVAATLIAALLVPATGEWRRLDLDAVSPPGWAVMGFVVLTGIVFFGSFAWLNTNVSSTTANTFTYVAPVLTLVAGSVLLGEPLTLGRASAAVTAMIGVVLIVISRRSEHAR